MEAALWLKTLWLMVKPIQISCCWSYPHFMPNPHLRYGNKSWGCSSNIWPCDETNINKLYIRNKNGGFEKTSKNVYTWWFTTATIKLWGYKTNRDMRIQWRSISQTIWFGFVEQIWCHGVTQFMSIWMLGREWMIKLGIVGYPCVHHGYPIFGQANTVPTLYGSMPGLRVNRYHVLLTIDHF